LLLMPFAKIRKCHIFYFNMKLPPRAAARDEKQCSGECPESLM
jgi:hypothetical protein